VLIYQFFHHLLWRLPGRSEARLDQILFEDVKLRLFFRLTTIVGLVVVILILLFIVVLALFAFWYIVSASPSFVVLCVVLPEISFFAVIHLLLFWLL
jgi:hypothetical protein